MIQCFSGWGRVQTATLSRLLGAFLHSWSVFSSLRILNWVLTGILPGFRCLQQCRYVGLLVWWLSRSDINHLCNPCMMDAIVVSLISASEPLITSPSMRSKELCTFFRWHGGQIACSGTWATWLTWTLSISFACRQFDSMLEVIVAAIYRNLISVYSGCLNLSNGSCASLCIIDVSRDWIVKNILQINGTVQKTCKTINITRTNLKNKCNKLT